jgi:hypothetical protein
LQSCEQSEPQLSVSVEMAGATTTDATPPTLNAVRAGCVDVGRGRSVSCGVRLQQLQERRAG